MREIVYGRAGEVGMDAEVGGPTGAETEEVGDVVVAAIAGGGFEVRFGSDCARWIEARPVVCSAYSKSNWRWILHTLSSDGLFLLPVKLV